MPSAPRLLITAGPTHEPIDAVRYIGNRSSGRMGLSLAEAAASRGWPTTLLLGPTPLTPPVNPHIHTLRFQTTSDLQLFLRTQWPQHDVLFMVAAVADYRPVPATHGADGTAAYKIKRGDAPLTLQLEPTPDLVAEVTTTSRPDQFVIGFALEPEDRLLASAKEKLVRKRLHAIVANPLETMDSPTINGCVILTDGSTLAPGKVLPKPAFADWLLDVLLPRMPPRDT